MPPKTREFVANQSVLISDDLGLPMDPSYYAKPTCRLCAGDGVINRIAKDNVRSMATCGCVEPRYVRARRELKAVLEQRGLS